MCRDEQRLPARAVAEPPEEESGGFVAGLGCCAAPRKGDASGAVARRGAPAASAPARGQAVAHESGRPVQAFIPVDLSEPCAPLMPPSSPSSPWMLGGGGLPRLLSGGLCCQRRRPHSKAVSQGSPLQRPSEAGLPAAEARSLQEFQVLLGPDDLERVRKVLVPGESLDACLLRFLRARDFRLSPAMLLLRKDLDWREQLEVVTLPDRTMEEVVGCQEQIIHDNRPMWHQGFDKEGTPVVFKLYGGMNMSELLKHTTVEKLEMLHVRENEAMARVCGQQSLKLGREISKTAYIIDCEGFSAGHLRSASSLTYAMKLASVDQDHYPERLGYVMMINAPYVLSLFWAMISAVLDKKTNAKFTIMSSRRQWEPALREILGDQLPPEYGGTCSLTPAATPATCRSGSAQQN